MNRKISLKALILVMSLIALLSTPILYAEEEKKAEPAAAEKKGEEKLVEHESGFYYTVKEGDTLWDLSQRFSDTPWEWPELWRDNKKIPNPHRIFPGDRIRIYHHKGSEKVFDGLTAEDEKEPPYYYYSAIESVGFIRKTPEKSLGTLIKTRFNKVMIDRGDMVYITPDIGADAFTPGSRYTLFRMLPEVKMDGRKVGIQHLITGVVEIEKVESGVVVGWVVKAYRPIKTGDKLMPYEPKSRRIILQESVTGLEGQVIAAEDHLVQIGDNVIIFINKGKDDGIKRGQMYTLFDRKKKSRVSEKQIGVLLTKKDVMIPYLDFGKLLVLRTEAKSSTALVTYTDVPFKKGTPFHGPLN
jgi:hypothetical protein